MKLAWSLILLFSASLPYAVASGKRPKELILERDSDSGKCTFITSRETQIFRGLREDGVHVSKLKTVSNNDKLSIIAHNTEKAWTEARSLCLGFENVGSGSPSAADSNPAQMALSVPDDSFEDFLKKKKLKLDIKPLFQTGPSSNRVDLVFFSDGYTKAEKKKFINDARRLAEDISYNQTFFTVKPLLNFWAAFTPSNDSGIGVGGKPKDTAFGLYRDGTELRGVYYSKPEVARGACLSMGDRCDYPILLGNDPFYGGLGGEFTVITPSLANGALVLRHELGHSIIEVGEEYDGGFAYFGVNSLHRLGSYIPWSKWLSPPPPPPKHPHDDSSHKHPHKDELADLSFSTRVERSVMPMQTYPWTLLNSSKPWRVHFTSSGQYARHLVRFSLSGLPHAYDLTVMLDGKDLGWKPRPNIGLDRWHYDVHIDKPLKEGLHELEFRLESSWLEGTAQLCSTEILEFGTEEEFVSTPGHYALYPTFSDTNVTSYRPTNEDCLMRAVTKPNFCKACLEGLWLSLLRRVDFIDTFTSTCEQVTVSPPTFQRVVEVNLVRLGQFRYPYLATDDKDGLPYEDKRERYNIRWYKDGVELEEFADKMRVEIDDEGGEGIGLYSVEVKLETPEVRSDSDGLLKSLGDFIVRDECGF